ncbi:hypothetical protein ETQ85_18290 [Zoogloea oleivorans]|uniref:Transposase DDE domain-containing protein n=1 Tax=Zoogloea oleivorans TaxID=1552750 RepID=A0A6C2CNC8_9RHOO|nr:hypothetical protein ETQ85_18290 [Zoogloea oleivorans]
MSAGQAHESLFAEPVLDAVRIVQPHGSPRRRPERLGGDRGYCYRRIRNWFHKHHVGAVTSARSTRPEGAAARPAAQIRPPYCRRNVIERCVSWLKEARAVATRFEKLAVHYLGCIKLAMIRRHLQAILSNRP